MVGGEGFVNVFEIFFILLIYVEKYLEVVSDVFDYVMRSVFVWSRLILNLSDFDFEELVV